MVQYWPINERAIVCNGPSKKFKTPVSVNLELGYIKEVPVRYFSVVVKCDYNGNGRRCSRSRLECPYEKMSSSGLKRKFFSETTIYREGVVPFRKN